MKPSILSSTRFLLIPVASALLIVRSSPLIAQNPAAIAPGKVIDLLADPSFKDFTYHLNAKKSSTDKREEIWKIEDEKLHVIGKAFGYIRTNQKYKDYHLVMEYQWGEHTWTPREDRARDCGLLVHGHGEDGTLGDTWMSSVEAQLIEGGSGDILVLQGKGADGKLIPSSLTSEVVKDRDGEDIWEKGGKAKVFPEKGKQNQRINWRDRDPDWADVKGYRSKNDIENPVGEWNRMEVICKGGNIDIYINGELVNSGTQAMPAEGFICLQTESAECWLRRFELWPLGQFKEPWKVAKRSEDLGYSPDGSAILPRRFALSAEESLKSWQIDGDFELELVASEPLVCDPVDVVWDERGRMFVAEMRDYPLPPEHGPLLSRIRLLDDKDGDGKMDTAITWADNLDHVQGLLPMNGGLLATTRNAIIFLEDKDGDGKADKPIVLFRSNDPRHNQLQVSAPRWGLDNAVYLNNGLDGKEIYPAGNEDAKLKFGRKNLRYDPVSKQMSAVTGRGQFGASQDDWGRRFFCSNRNPDMFAVMEQAAISRNPYAGIKDGVEDIAPFGGVAKVYPLQLTHTTADAHAGTYTAACGIGVYRGDLVAEMKGDIFTCEPTGQLVTRSSLEANGASLKAIRIGDKKEFLASRDTWSRPVNTRNGPDGALYIVDMYRQIIDHSRFMPEEYTKTHYMRAGFDQGRIYRVVPKGGGKRRPIQALPRKANQLVVLLESPNAWHRIGAQRLMVEKQDKTVIPALVQLLSASKSAQAQVHAMWTLDGLGALKVEHVQGLLASKESGVVENAIQAAALRFADNEAIHQTLFGFVKQHDSGRVQFMAASAMAGHDKPEITSALTALVGKNAQDKWMRNAVLSASENRAGKILAALLKDPDFTSKAAVGRIALVLQFANAAAARGDLGELKEVLSAIAAAKQKGAWWQYATINGLSSGLRRSKLKQKSIAALIASPPEELKEQIPAVKEVLDSAKAQLKDRSRPTADRLAALPLVQQKGIAEMLPIVEKLIDQREPVEIQQAACQALSRFDRNVVADFFFERWKELGPTPRREALALISGNGKTVMRLMKKMKKGEINPSLMDPMRRWVLARSKDPATKKMATELFGQASGDRGKVIAKYKPALAKGGDAAAGMKVFETNCVVCHRKNGKGVEVGPDITDVKIKPAEALLSDILDPNRMVEERWSAYTILVKDGRTLMGLVSNESSDAVTLKMMGGIVETVPRSEIVKMETVGLSLMPVGLEAAISEKQMADLIQFLKK
ncbi:MAG: DUF1080 domain-containing protein [Verrucomicrobiales bacterium]|nr:DUF1080 domain-containing protein [Verrucomicrobiales bacterium]